MTGESDVNKFVNGVNPTPPQDPVQVMSPEQRLAKLESDYAVVWKVLNDVVGKHNSMVDGHIQSAITLLKKHGIIRDANPQE